MKTSSTMNDRNSSANTYARRSDDQDDVFMDQHDNSFHLNLGRELFMTPIANKIAMSTSPLAPCRNKHTREQYPFQDQKPFPELLLPKDNDITLNIKTPVKHRLVQRLSHPVTFEEECQEMFMTPISNKIRPSTSPPALCRDRKRTRQCAFQDHQLCSKFHLPTFDEDGNVGNRANIRKSSFKFHNVEHLSHPLIFKKEKKKTNSMNPYLPLTNQVHPLLSNKTNEEPRDRTYGLNSKNIKITTLPQQSDLKRKQYSVTALTA